MLGTLGAMSGRIYIVLGSFRSPAGWFGIIFGTFNIIRGGVVQAYYIR